MGPLSASSTPSQLAVSLHHPLSQSEMNSHAASSSQRAWHAAGSSKAPNSASSSQKKLSLSYRSVRHVFGAARALSGAGGR